MSLPMQPYEVAVPDTVLADLNDRLDRTRWPNEIEDIGHGQGPALAWIQEVAQRWRHGYDWRATETRINSHPQLMTEVDGQPIHLVHQRSSHADALPLILLHGWGATFTEFLDVIGPLTEPPDGEIAFHVVVPSPPGFAFSGPTSRRGWGPRHIAEAFDEIMRELGYDRYAVQGGDFGSVIAAKIADVAASRVIGLHLNYPPEMRSSEAIEKQRPPRGFDLDELTDDERAGLAADADWRRRYFGDNRLKATQPQRIGYALEDSPAGMAAFFLEGWRHTCDGDIRDAFTTDQLLDTVMIHWVTGTATSSMRLYWELAQDVTDGLPRGFVDVPTGIATFPAEVSHTPRRWVEHRYRVTHWTRPARGGHFAALETPDLFVDDVRTFFRSLHPASTPAPQVAPPTRTP